ncbi:hypothetical protein [Methylobacterium radiotolerans]|uniref:hypothetical protein n=1 Tax=Methylobacterium radiotolerans TaxID=31998 RepID=UPI0038D1388E
MNEPTSYVGGAAILLALTSTGPASAEPAELPALEKAWHSCVRDAYDHQPEHGSRAGRERNALNECQAHEDAYVAALMSARPAYDLPLGRWAQTWAAYLAFVVNPVKAWIETLRR